MKEWRGIPIRLKDSIMEIESHPATDGPAPTRKSRMTSRLSIAERTLKSQADRIRVSISIIDSEIDKLKAQREVLSQQITAIDSECYRLQRIREHTPPRTKT